MGEIEKIEEKLKGETNKEDMDIPRSEIPVNSTEVLDVLWHNASVNLDNPVDYKSKDRGRQSVFVKETRHSGLVVKGFNPVQ